MNPVQIAHSKGYRCDESGAVISPRGRTMATEGRYPRFRIKIEGGKTKHVFVHRLQAFQKFGMEVFAEGIQVRHLDGNSRNASANNLALGTRSQNEMDKSPEVRVRCAKAAASAIQKHDHAEVIGHYKEYGFKDTLSKFGLSKGTLSFIVNKSLVARTSGVPIIPALTSKNQ